MSVKNKFLIYQTGYLNTYYTQKNSFAKRKGLKSIKIMEIHHFNHSNHLISGINKPQ